MHDPIFDRMHFIAQFELRALIEELIAAPDEAARQEVLAAMRVWLRLHCESCGTLISHDLRRQGERYCYICFPPPDRTPPTAPPNTPGQPDDSDVPF